MTYHHKALEIRYENCVSSQPEVNDNAVADDISRKGKLEEVRYLIQTKSR